MALLRTSTGIMADCAIYGNQAFLVRTRKSDACLGMYRGKNKGARGNGQWGGAWMGTRGALYCNGHEAAVCCCCSAEGPSTQSPLKVFESPAAAFGTTRYLGNSIALLVEI